MHQDQTATKTFLYTSLLKPADDVRVVDRLLPSFNEHTSWRFISVGPGSGVDQIQPKSQILFKFPYRRGLMSRILHAGLILKFSLQVKPQVICINTTELLWVALANKILFGSLLVQDLQENEALNRQQSSSLITKWSGLLTALLFTISKAWTDRFWVAENVYPVQMKLPAGSWSYLPNIAIRQELKGQMPPPVKNLMLITGTISLPFGVLQGIEWVKEMRIKQHELSLLICGHCPDVKLFNHLQTQAQQLPWLSLEISAEPLPHELLLQRISSCEILLCPYQNLPSIRGKYPSKFREAARLGKPVLCPDFNEWRFSHSVSGPIPGTLLIHGYLEELEAEEEQFKERLGLELGHLGMP
jgi:hypothetical protein